MDAASPDRKEPGVVQQKKKQKLQDNASPKDMHESPVAQSLQNRENHAPAMRLVNEAQEIDEPLIVAQNAFQNEAIPMQHDEEEKKPASKEGCVKVLYERKTSTRPKSDRDHVESVDK